MAGTKPHIDTGQPVQSDANGSLSAPAQHISFLTAEFTDTNIEQQFRRRDEQSAARQATIAFMIGGVLNLAFGYNDYIILGIGTKFWLLIGARTIALLLGAIGVSMMLRRPSLATSGTMPTMLEIVFIACFTFVVLERPLGVQWHVMIMVVITLAYYLFLPNRFIYAAAIGMASMGIFISTAVISMSLSYVEMNRMILILATANMIGMVAAYRLSNLRRREFLLLQMAETANAQLRAEVSERQRLAEELKRMATTDELTGLSNRRHYLDLSMQEIKRARRLDTPLTVCVLDVDHFKQINDNFGHAVGDVALRAIAAACRDSLREIDILGRFGGEEFTITLPETNAQTAQEVAERLRKRIEELRLNIEGVRLSVTIGLAERKDEEEIDQLLTRADHALYAGKRSGRNRVVDAPQSIA